MRVPLEHRFHAHNLLQRLLYIEIVRLTDTDSIELSKDPLPVQVGSLQRSVILSTKSLYDPRNADNTGDRSTVQSPKSPPTKRTAVEADLDEESNLQTVKKKLRTASAVKTLASGSAPVAKGISPEGGGMGKVSGPSPGRSARISQGASPLCSPLDRDVKQYILELFQDIKKSKEWFMAGSTH